MTSKKHPVSSILVRIIAALATGLLTSCISLIGQDDSDSPVDVDMTQPSNTLRVHYKNIDSNYENMLLWAWHDTSWKSETGWPNGIEAKGVDDYGAVYDIPLKSDAELVGFSMVRKTAGEPIKDAGDKLFSDLENFKEVWIRQGDNRIYVTKDYEPIVTMGSASIISDSQIEILFDSTIGLTADHLSSGLTVTPNNGQPQKASEITVGSDGRSVLIAFEIDSTALPYKVTFNGAQVSADKGWKYTDNQFAYTGPLGPELMEDGSATLRVWSPYAQSINVILYDNESPDTVLADDIAMSLGESGVWSVVLDETNTGLTNLSGYYYNYEITHENYGTKIALDPYAKSMAPFNKDLSHVGKGAIVNPAQIGVEIPLEYAVIPGFSKREDAIIWEVHVRDLTVDPNIESQLTHPFGTFEAVIDRLDYIKSLGVTHIQFLPVMSYYWGDEMASRIREMEYASEGNNYNWGYDPHSYFSLSGMYSVAPQDAESRILEFKKLVSAIHEKGMGVILDVVYNHTSRTTLFEDLAPNYYHFMDVNGKAKESFGGGRLGTTHAMARRILVDSIRYWTSEFKVDGFRFDMMGDHDAESLQIAYDTAKALNPNLIMLGEGWRTYAGDDGDPRKPADQDWMAFTDSVSVFSDEIRNELKSGYGSEGEPRFITGGARSTSGIFANIKAQPSNFVTDDPGDVVSYIAAHDNLTLHDVIAQSIKKDPDIVANAEEIHKRIRIGNALILTSQGVAFLHAGQEYGRTKQWRAEGKPEHKITVMVDQSGQPFQYPRFVHDSYDSSDIVNRFEWLKVTDELNYPLSVQTKNYTAGLIALRRSTDAFRLGSKDLVDSHVKRINIPEIKEQDLAIAFTCMASDSSETFYVFINADSVERTFSLGEDTTALEVLVDQNSAGTEAILQPTGFTRSAQSLTIQPLTVVVLKK